MILNFDAIKNTNLIDSPFPYMVVDNVINPDRLNSVISSFPEIESGGSFTLDSCNIEMQFKDLVDEIHHDELRILLAEKFSINLDDAPIMITLRGWSRLKDGRIHTDSKSKLLTMLIYMNETWDSENGCLRVLNNESDMNDFVEEVKPLAGTSIIFKVTDNCWHGYSPFEGERKSIQINFIKNEGMVNKHLFVHKLSAFFKKYILKK